MRFFFVSSMSGTPWGGSEELWSGTALRLCQQGHEVSASVVGWPQLCPQVMALEDHGIKLFFRQQAGHLSPTIRAWHKVKNELRPQAGAVKWLQKHLPDLVVISQGGNGDGVRWMGFCRAAKVPYVAIIHCNSETMWPNDDRGAKMATSYRAAKRVFCVSRGNLELLERQLGESLPNAEVAWNPFNVPTTAPPAWPTASKVWKLACVARLEPAAKGQDLLLQVLSQARWRERPMEVSLYGAGPSEQGLKRWAVQLRCTNVRFRGHVANVQQIWDENQLLILPSRYEGLPLALVEAMWCGRPAIVTDVGGNAELCLDGETGYVADAPAVKLLDTTLERAWHGRANWHRLGLAARARVEHLVPKDPVGDFCGKLLECASSAPTR